MHQAEIITGEEAVGGVAGSLCLKYELVLQKFAVLRCVLHCIWYIFIFRS